MLRVGSQGCRPWRPATPFQITTCYTFGQFTGRHLPYFPFSFPTSASAPGKSMTEVEWVLTRNRTREQCWKGLCRESLVLFVCLLGWFFKIMRRVWNRMKWKFVRFWGWWQFPRWWRAPTPCSFKFHPLAFGFRAHVVVYVYERVRAAPCRASLRGWVDPAFKAGTF